MGEEGFVTVVYNSANRPGRFNKTAKVYTNIDNQITILKISGNVIPTPGKLRQKIGVLSSAVNNLDFGKIYYQQNDSRTIIIENPKESDIFMRIVNTPEYLNVKIEPEILAPGEKGEIQVTFDSKLTKIYGSFRDIIRISMKSGEQVYNGAISVKANVVEDFSHLSEKELLNSPKINFPKKSYNLGTVNINEKRNVEFEFENRGETDLIIRNIEINNNSFIMDEYDKKIEPGGKGVFTLFTNPANRPGKLNMSIKVISNDPVNSEAKLQLIGVIESQSVGSQTINSQTITSVQSDGLEKRDDHTFIKEIQIQDAISLVKEYQDSYKLIILDVRTPREYEEGYLSGAINIDYENQNFKKTMQLLDKSRMYLVYCKTGHRSEYAAAIMKKLGFEMVYHMYEGIAGWKEKGLELDYPRK